MSHFDLAARIEQDRTNPQKRAMLERSLAALGDSNPVEAAYTRAILNGDVVTVQKILTYKAIFRRGQRAKSDAFSARYLKHLLRYLSTLDASGAEFSA